MWEISRFNVSHIISRSTILTKHGLFPRLSCNPVQGKAESKKKTKVLEKVSKSSRICGRKWTDNVSGQDPELWHSLLEHKSASREGMVFQRLAAAYVISAIGRDWNKHKLGITRRDVVAVYFCNLVCPILSDGLRVCRCFCFWLCDFKGISALFPPIRCLQTHR